MADQEYRRLSCADCARPFDALRRQGRPAARCTDCTQSDRMDKTPRHCGACGAQFVPVKRVQGACSKKCARQMRQPLKPLQRIPCARCGAEFQQLQVSAMFCSGHCALRDWRSRNPARWQDLQAACAAKRRATIKGVDADRISPREVFRRDGWTCQLCGIATPESLRGSTSPQAPELDHKEPLARGGRHTLSNVWCLCRTCNGLKGAWPLEMVAPALSRFRLSV